MSELIKLEKIIVPAVRSRQKIEESKIEELADSINEVGLINAILVIKNKNKYEIIAGERRFLAFQRLGRKEIPCVVKKSKRDMNEEIKLAENICREDLNSIELALGVLKIQKKFGTPLNIIAKAIGKKVLYIERKLALLKLPGSIQDAIKKRLITDRVGMELGRIEDEVERERLLTYAVANGVTWKVVNTWVESWILNSKRAQEQKQKETEKLNTSPGREIQVSCLLCGGKEDITKVEYVPVHRECKAELMYKIHEQKLNQTQEG